MRFLRGKWPKKINDKNKGHGISGFAVWMLRGRKAGFLYGRNRGFRFALEAQ
jgi:hypothetical protein